MAAAERPDHGANSPERLATGSASRAFARCGLRSIGSCAPVIQRHANSGHSATTPGRISSRSVFGAPETLGSSRATARGKKISANPTPAKAYASNAATTTCAISSGTVHDLRITPELT